MKRVLSVLALSALSLSAQAIPRRAPDVGIQTGPDKYIWLSQQGGKTCVLAFVLTTCPHCQFTLGILNKIQTDYAEKGVLILASAVEPMASLHLDDLRKLIEPRFMIGYNEQTYIAKFLGLPENDPMMMPRLAMVDRNGMIQAQYGAEEPSMAKDVQEKTLRDTLDRILKATTPAPKTVTTRRR